MTIHTATRLHRVHHLMTGRAALACCAAAAITLAGPGTTGAQDAIGDGRALDRNLQVGSGGRNTTRSVDDFRRRNLLVTGNVAGGRGFRGSVGYSAEGDFRAATGSDEFFGFRAESALSSIDLLRYGGNYQSLRYSQPGALLEFHRSTYTGQTAGRGGTLIAPYDSGALRSTLDRMQLDRAEALSSRISVEPRAAGLVFDGDGRAALAEVSALRGVSYTPLEDDQRAFGFSTLDAALIERDIESGTRAGEPFELRFNAYRVEAGTSEPSTGEGGLVDNIPTVGRLEARRDDGLPADYRQVLQRVLERYIDSDRVNMRIDDRLLEQLDIDMEMLRQRTRGRAGTIDPVTGRPRPGGTETPAMPGNQPPTVPPGDEQPDEGEPPDDDSTRPADDLLTPLTPGGIDRFGVVLRHDQELTTLTGEQEDRFNDLMRTAEDRLRTGEYMLAERRFVRALRLSPGHPLATAGLGHAQLGAGLYLSAALTLHTMLGNHPEMIDVQYSEALLPNRVRLLNAATYLEDKIIDDDPQSGDYGFLLAYIGHQIDDRQMISNGLDTFAEARGDDEAELLTVLREVWLADEPVK